MRMLLRPRFDWGRQVPAVTQGSTHLRFVGPSQTLRLNSDAPLSYILSETCFVVDRPMNFILGPDETLLSRHRGHRARVRAGDGQLLAHLDPRACRCRWSGRRR